MSALPLSGVQVTSLAVNLPGPAAAWRLVSLGADVVKVEPPDGDPLQNYSPAWYEALCAGQQVVRLNLKQEQGRARLYERLARSDLLLTTNRPAALARLGLAWESLHKTFPNLCQVALIGYPAPDGDRPGHDLTYQAWLGMLKPPDLPHTLLADLAGAERAVSAGLALLLGHERGRGGGYAEVSLVEAAVFFTHPARYGLTTPEGIFGGGFPGYGLYATRKGWLAVAALEGHFWEKLVGELGLGQAENIREQLQEVFLGQTAEDWEAWAIERDLPLVAVRER